ncbi:hypothetical protein [Hymenobacter volaticus]|uniref:DUF2029 domain-containing protein n=1 Tax=Hymenobacter volaticus TaxID=2932254 RepID=A0ABY4G5K1_9BACT|nr:hypothetical protein [Hymenobacter volaticus]UOQ66031.1 hypothetical protein MUN86_21370 [Hymenobacter volaticus]
MSFATWLLLAACIVEFLLFTFLRNLFGPFVSPVALWLTGVVVALSGLRVFRGVTPPVLKPLSGRSALGILLPITALGLFAGRVARMLSRSVIDPAQSDVIPSIEIMLRRWLTNEAVYVPITDFGYVIYPTYLPMMWMPFAPAELLHFDYRWTAYGGFALAVLTGIVLLLRRRLPMLPTLALLAVPLLLMQAVLQTASTTITSTVELMIVAFYLLLAYSIWRGPWWVQAITLTLCLLSRFSLVFWVPLWLGLLWQNRGKTEALRVAGLAAVLVLAIYIVPFLSHDWGAFARAQITYTEAAIGEWEEVAPNLPEHLYKGVGLAVFFRQYAPAP